MKNKVNISHSGICVNFAKETEMKQAYLIIAHNKIEQLKFLLSLLDYEKHDIYILFDKKSNIRNEQKIKILQAVKTSSVFFTEEIPVYWGDYSQVEAEMILFETAAKNGRYSMYHLLSGVDLPLDTAQNIYQFFDEHKQYSFVNISPKEVFQRVKAEDRIKYYYLNTKVISRRNTKNRLLKALFTIYRKIEKAFQRFIGVNRTKNIIVSYGSNWCSLNQKSVEIILHQKGFIEETFKNSYLADELVIHTTLATFNAFDNFYHYDSTDDFQGNLRYINWWDGDPHTWTDSEHDIEQLKRGKSLGHKFSRKFDLEKYPNLKEEILTIINGTD